MNTKSREQRRRDWRSVRVGATAGLIPSLTFVPLDIFVLHAPWAALLQGFLLLACAATIVLATRKMRQWPEPVSRVDYSAIAAMERDVWGVNGFTKLGLRAFHPAL